MHTIDSNFDLRLPSSTDPLRILLVEDSQNDALLIGKVIEQALLQPYTVQQTKTLEDALQLLTEEEFDIALLDRALPDVEGFGGLHSIQSIAPRLPVIFLTAYQDENTALSAIEQGAQDYLFKDKLDVHTIRRAIQYAILRKQFEGVLIIRANYDMLTGLANRMLFENRLDIALSRIKRQGGSIGLLFLDLDQFKQINDTLGHLAGDTLLKEVAARLKRSLRPYDTAARFGGDEFAILLEEPAEVPQSEAVAQKILKLFEPPFQVMGKAIEAHVSIGISSCSNHQLCNKNTLMQQADAAMYRAKTHSGSSYQFHEDDALQAL